jgi:hypothetical protein
MAHEIIKKSKKDIHDYREAAKKVEKAAELEKRIGIAYWLVASTFVFRDFELIDFFYRS